MRWSCSSQILSTFLVIIIFCFSVQVDSKRIRRRRQYISNNYGNYALDPAVIAYYGTNGGGSYTGNGQQNNRFVVGGVAYQYPTPVNIMSAGSYNPQEYNSFPSGADGYYYNMNNMRLSSPDGWYSYYYHGYAWPLFVNGAKHHANVSVLFTLFTIIFTCLMFINIL